MAVSQSGCLKHLTQLRTYFITYIIADCSLFNKKKTGVIYYWMNHLLKSKANVCKTRAKVLGYDIEIVEAHHKFKKDAPSGTAVQLSEVVANTLGRDLKKDGVYGRKGISQGRGLKEIGIHTLRAGDIVGEHRVLFGGMGEALEFIHRAQSRETFARGSITAAKWIVSQSPGLYNMEDVLGLDREK